MEEIDVETIAQRALEKFPGEQPRFISDNGSQFVSKQFKEFIRITGMTHVKTSPYYPQANGKMERWYKTVKGECIRVKVPLLDDARRIVSDYVVHYNDSRLHSAIGYVTPKDRLEGRHTEIFAERDRKLLAARERRKDVRHAEHERQESRQTCQPTVTTRPAIDFAAVRAAVTMADVLGLLGFQARSTHGSQQRGSCPLHGSTSGTSRCFSVNLRDGMFHCFKCAARAMFWTCGLKPRGKLPTMRHATSANA